MIDDTHYNEMDKDLSYETIVLVSRGDDIPKKNYEKKKHPTYETSIRIKVSSATRRHSQMACRPHVVCKFFDQYRNLHEELHHSGVGKDQPITIEADFPPTHTASSLGMHMTEIQLQERCYMLNKWMQAIVAQFPSFPDQAQKLISDFLSLHDGDVESEMNKELILNILKRGWKRYSMKADNSTAPSSTIVPFSSDTESGKHTPPDRHSKDEKHKKFVYERSDSRSSNRTKLVSSRSSFSSNNFPDVGSSGNSHKGDGSVTSKGTETSKGYVLIDYAPEPIMVNGFLAVSVTPMAHDKLSKSDAVLEEHCDYEMVLRVLPFDDISVPNKSEIDIHQYSKYVDLPPIRIHAVFERYVALKEELQKEGIFSRRHWDEAQSYNAKMAEYYGTNSQLAILLDCDFPRVHRRTSWGISLSKVQLQDRWVLLHTWMGQLFKKFHLFPTSAQEKIVNFMELAMKDIHMVDPESVKVVNFNDPAQYCKIFMLMLRNSFMPPKKALPAAIVVMGNTEKKGKISSKNKSGNSNEVAFTKTEAVILVDGVNDAVVVNPLGYRHVRSNSSSHFVSNNSASSMTAANLIELRKETVIYSFLGLQVKMADFDNDNKDNDICYETVLRILPFTDVVYAESHKVDEDAYMAMQNELKPISIIKDFTGYQVFKDELEEKGVFCRNRSPSGSNDKKFNKGNTTHSLMIINAAFPKSYRRRSSFGLSLSDRKLRTRAALLNCWMGQLISHFHAFSTDVQHIIWKFFTNTQVDEFGTEQHGNAFTLIDAMLHRKFVPPLKFTVTIKKKKRFLLLSKKIEEEEDVDKNSNNGSGSVSSLPDDNNHQSRRHESTHSQQRAYAGPVGKRSQEGKCIIS